jgi:hypothetical protein
MYRYSLPFLRNEAVPAGTTVASQDSYQAVAQNEIPGEI